MRRKEVLLAAVIGGVVGALLVMAMGSITPIGAQNYVKDAEFGEITCRILRGVDHKGKTVVKIQNLDVRPLDGGGILLFGKNGRAGSLIGTDKHGGTVSLSDTDGESRVIMRINEFGDGVISTWDKNGYLVK